MEISTYKEVTARSLTSERWNDVIINAGASQSTLQDIKLPEGAGCYTYRSSADFLSSCSNRFIYWRTNHDVIELVEISLDVTLRNNRLRLRFQNTPILRGVSVHETNDQVVLLLATVSAIHKVSFPHPVKLELDNCLVKKRELVLLSIFHDSTTATLRTRSCYYVLNHVSLGVPLPHTACTWLDFEGRAAFALADGAGSLLLSVMSDDRAVDVTTCELAKTGSLFRIFDGLVPSVLRSDRTDVALSIVCHRGTSDIWVFAIFSDLQLRIWSYKRRECLLAVSLLNYDTEKHLSTGNFTAHQCCLRISSTGHDSEFYLGVYIPMSRQKVFYVFRPCLAYDRRKLELILCLTQIDYDLVDFCLGTRNIWTLWLSSENQPLILTSMIPDGVQAEEPQFGWIPISLESRVSRTIDIGMSTPKDAYLREIFKVGRFLPSTILKAVGIYRSTRDSSFVIDVPVEELKARVVDAVENEILSKAGDADDSESEYLEVSAECWDRFFSYCIQYHEVGMKPLGIAVDPYSDCAVIIKKISYSLICPCDPQISADVSHVSLLSPIDNPQLRNGLNGIIACINILRENVDEKLLINLEEKLFESSSLTNYMSEICKEVNLEPEDGILKSFQSHLPSNSDIVASLKQILGLLDLSSREKDNSNNLFVRYPNFANSSFGIGLLCAGLTCFAKQRYEFCRDLLLFEVVLWNLETMETDQLENLMSQLNIIPQTVLLVRSYYTILWCMQRECVKVQPEIQEAAQKQFCILELPEYLNAIKANADSDRSIVQFFLQEDGGNEARKIMEAQLEMVESEMNWTFLFPGLISSVAALLWPADGSFLFSEFLFAHCQFQPLLEYNHLLQGWCIWNKQSRNFLSACSYLILDEPKKALEIFLEVSKKVEGEDFLCNKLMKGRYNANSSSVSTFCMLVVRMFEQSLLSECVVEIATKIVEETSSTDSLVPVFYSLLFKHHLELRHIEEAFSTLVKNPDASRKKDCLRQLIVKLCETKQFQKIVEISYLAFEEDVIRILESRARCLDLHNDSSYYGILYALHVHHKKYRKAAAVMYELGARYGREVNTYFGLQKQSSCYLATISCLHLAEPEYAWIVKPVPYVPEISASNVERLSSSSPKRNSDGEEIQAPSRPTKVDVLGLEDIIREYDLVRARLLYCKKNRHPNNLTIAPLTPEETVTLLLNSCLFQAAIQLSKSYSLSLVPVFDTLAYKCLSSILNSGFQKNHESENYLRYNDSQLDISTTYIDDRHHVWYLLKSYLLEYEEKGMSCLHRCITEKLLANGVELPAWLKRSYQQRNASELLQLYITHGLMEDAVILAVKYMKATLGIKKEDFNIKHALHVNSLPVWIPHAYIDILLDAVSEYQDNECFQELYKELITSIDEYNKTVESVTEMKLKQVQL